MYHRALYHLHLTKLKRLLQKNWRNKRMLLAKLEQLYSKLGNKVSRHTALDESSGRVTILPMRDQLSWLMIRLRQMLYLICPKTLLETWREILPLMKYVVMLKKLLLTVPLCLIKMLLLLIGFIQQGLQKLDEVLRQL